jgi:hypothetical protein
MGLDIIVSHFYGVPLNRKFMEELVISHVNLSGDEMEDNMEDILSFAYMDVDELGQLEGMTFYHNPNFNTIFLVAGTILELYNHRGVNNNQKVVQLQKPSKNDIEKCNNWLIKNNLTVRKFKPYASVSISV